MNSRIEKLRDALHVDKYPLSVEKARLWTKSFRESEGEPMVMRRAKALVNILENITIFIQDGELIVGNTASKPMGLEVVFWAGTWPQEEIDGLKNEFFSISDEEQAELRSLSLYWKGKTLTDRAEQMFDEERLWPFMESPVILPVWKRGVGWGGYAESGLGLGPYALVAPDYAKVLNNGIEGIIAEAEEELRSIRMLNPDAIKKADFLKAVITAQKGVIHLAGRFALLADRMASEEKDPIRKKELKQIAENCRRVPAKPARTFYEAIQSFWFMFLVMSPNGCLALGRFDQFMYPFYKRDKENGIITDEEAVELLECLRIKDMQLIRTGSQVHREKWSGLAKWHNCVIGGQTPDGKDATNDLTYLILEAAQDWPTPHHTITLRVHDNTPDSLMLKALEVVKTGVGMPAFVSDMSYTQFLLNEGLPLDVARDYTIAGCLDIAVTGQSRVLADPMFITPLVLEITLNNGRDRKTGKQLGLKTGEMESFVTFSDLMDAFKKQIVHFAELTAEHNAIKFQIWSELFPDPVTSSLMADAIKGGKPMHDRRFPYENGAVLNPVGLVNVADSLAAIKKLVFDEKKVTMKELKEALASNWEGNGYPELRKAFLAAPKYGNDDDYADSITKELFDFFAETAVTLPNYQGGRHKPSAISISAQWPGGLATGATPDGRFSGECLADGGMSAMRGRDRHGPTALLKSAMKIDQVPYQATLLNMKFHPSALKSKEDMKKLADLMKIYFANGGKHVQFNVVNAETLIEAQKEPEYHRDLVVRVAGYSAYFVELSRNTQKEIIERTEYRKAT